MSTAMLVAALVQTQNTPTTCKGKVIGEGRVWNPLLQELTVVVSELNVISSGLNAVVHRVRYVDHHPNLAEARDG
jgi:hypothetical protein